MQAAGVVGMQSAASCRKGSPLQTRGVGLGSA